MSNISRLPNRSPVTAEARPEGQSPGHADASQVRPQERQLGGALGGLARPPVHLDGSPSSSSRAATAKFSAPAVQHTGQAMAAQASALQARFPEASATAIQGLAAEGFSADGIARIVGSEGGAAALAELYDNKYLSALRAVGFSDDDIVELAASGNGEQTIHQAMQVYSAMASASEKATGGAFTGYLKIDDENIIRAIGDAVGTPKWARMCSLVRFGRLPELQVLAVFGDDRHLLANAARGVMPPYIPR